MVHDTATAGVTAAIAVVKTIILILGGIITYYSYRAYSRTEARAFGALTVGFGTITFGALLAGAVDVLVDVPLAVGVLINSALTMIGFAVIAYSLYVE